MPPRHNPRFRFIITLSPSVPQPRPLAIRDCVGGLAKRWCDVEQPGAMAMWNGSPWEPIWVMGGGNFAHRKNATYSPLFLRRARRLRELRLTAEPSPNKDGCSSAGALRRNAIGGRGDKSIQEPAYENLVPITISIGRVPIVAKPIFLQRLRHCCDTTRCLWL